MIATTTPRGRIDWEAVRESINLAEVATRLLGPAPGRRGERGRRLWWPCPFHPDRNPSFCAEPGKLWWRCYGCGERGDAAALVMKLRGMRFPEAVTYLAETFLAGGPATAGSAPAPRPKPPERTQAAPPAPPSGMPEADARALVQNAERRLWTPEGTDARAYLHGRGLADATIRAARLGVTPWVSIPKADGGSFRALGVVIPWFLGGRLAHATIRQPGDRRPKYAEFYRDPARVRIYPGPEAIRPGRPLIIVEGQLDRLLLAQELDDRAAVVTLGGASARPTPDIFGGLLAAAPWYIATDADDAGDQAASRWPASARRVRPPAPHKDWTEAYQRGVDLRPWWADLLAGVRGTAADDPAPGAVSAALSPGPGQIPEPPEATASPRAGRLALPSLTLSRFIPLSTEGGRPTDPSHTRRAPGRPPNERGSVSNPAAPEFFYQITSSRKCK